MRKNLQTGRPVVRSTSADAYRKIRDEGLLSERRWQVYDALFAHGPCTGMELLEAMRRDGARSSFVDSQVRARLNELREIGCAKELGTTVCRVTGQKVILWDVTEAMPTEPEKKHCDRVKCSYCRGKGYVEQGRLFGKEPA